MCYKPLKGLRGMQIDSEKFQFFWDSAQDDLKMHFLWIYKEDELNNPRMVSYAQCVNNRVQVTFQYNNISMQEITQKRFLVFLSENQNSPTREEFAGLCRNPEYICEVCCGTGEVDWNWLQDKTGLSLLISSNKRIPEGILYYEYVYGNRNFRFEIPGDINFGENKYGNIYFPNLQSLPVLKSKEPNIMLKTEKAAPNPSTGLLEWFAGFFRR